MRGLQRSPARRRWPDRPARGQGTGACPLTRPGGSSGPQHPGDDADAKLVVIEIARLRLHLLRGNALHDPEVLRGLRGLEQDLAAGMSAGAAPPGRHRAAPQPPSLDEAAGNLHGLKPDPSAAATPAEFMCTLRSFKAWSGPLSWPVTRKSATSQLLRPYRSFCQLIRPGSRSIRAATCCFSAIASHGGGPE
jgi:hypothetical protein